MHCQGKWPWTIWCAVFHISGFLHFWCQLCMLLTGSLVRICLMFWGCLCISKVSLKWTVCNPNSTVCCIFCCVSLCTLFGVLLSAFLSCLTFDFLSYWFFACCKSLQIICTLTRVLRCSFFQFQMCMALQDYKAKDEPLVSKQTNKTKLNVHVCASEDTWSVWSHWNTGIFEHLRSNNHHACLWGFRASL